MREENVISAKKFSRGLGAAFLLIPTLLAISSVLAMSAWAGDRYHTLHLFKGESKDGAKPYAGLVMDQAGNLYGTTYQGGTYERGTVFRLTRHKDGKWTVRVLH